MFCWSCHADLGYQMSGLPWGSRFRPFPPVKGKRVGVLMAAGLRANMALPPHHGLGASRELFLQHLYGEGQTEVTGTWTASSSCLELPRVPCLWLINQSLSYPELSPSTATFRPSTYLQFHSVILTGATEFEWKKN